MKKLLIPFLVLALTGPLAVHSAIAAPSADEIVAKANQASYYPGKDGRAEVKMTITDRSGSSRSREFTILRINLAKENQKFYVYFKAPADVYKMAYLVWKNVGGSDDRWLWLPALNLKKRIAPGDKRTSFVGSDFYYEDVSGRGVHEDSHELVEETADAYIIKSTPKNPGEVEFAWFRVSIDKKSFLPKKAEYYDNNNEVYRVVEAVQIETIQGYPTVTVAEARDLKSGSTTRNEFSSVEYDLGLNERIFTERFLRRPPREIK
jgi:hypothetical protein